MKLYYTLFRNDTPVAGRWISRDPLGMVDGPNEYMYVVGDPVDFVDPLGLDLLDESASFCAGPGDVLLFGLTDWARDQFGISDYFGKSSLSYLDGEVAGVVLDTAIGGAGGWQAAGARGLGKEFSYWIPNRMGGPRSLWNSNYVSKAEPALSDPYRYRFMPKDWKRASEMSNVLNQQWNRIPKIYKEGVLEGAAGGAGASVSCEG